MTDCTLTILQDRAELDWLTLHQPERLAQAILTFDLELHLVLNDRGIEHLTPWEVFGTRDRNRMKQIESDLHHFWREHATVPHRGIDILKIASHRHTSALSRMVWVGCVVENSIEYHKPNRVLFFDCEGAHGLEQPPECRRLPLLPAIVRAVASQRNVEIEGLSFPERIKSAFDDVASRQAQPNDLPDRNLAELDGKPFVLLTGSGQDLLKQLPVIRKIEASGEYRAVQVYRFADEETLRQLRANGHTAIHDSQLNLPDAIGIDKATLQERQHAFDSAVTHTPQDCARWIPTSHVDFVFGEYAQKLSVQIDRWQVFFDRHKPGAFVGNYPDVAMEVAHQRSVRCLMLPHGGLSVGVASWYRSMPTVTLGVEGTAHATQLNTYGIEEDRIDVVDSFDIDETKVPHYDTPRNGSDRFNILLVTSRLADHSHDAELPGLNWKAAIDSLRSLITLASDRTNWHVTIKTHPRYDHPDLYDVINESLPPDRSFNIVTDQSVAACATRADVVVIPNVTSSAILNAARMGKPVVLLRDPKAIYQPNPRDSLLSNWPRVTDVSELIAHLELLASDEVAYESARQQTHQAYTDFFGQRAVAGSLMEFIRRNKKARITDEGNPCPLIALNHGGPAEPSDCRILN